MKIKTNCLVKYCKNKYGGWLDVSWVPAGKKHCVVARIPLCAKHFYKIYPRLKEIEKAECESGHKWLYAPLDKVNQILAEK